MGFTNDTLSLMHTHFYAFSYSLTLALVAFLPMKSHYSFYLTNGMSILEFGAADQSYLPSNLQLKQHVGIGAIQEQMDMNPSLTSSMVLDLNDVVDDVGLRGEEEIMRTLLSKNGEVEEEGFDAIIMANTIDFLVSPREVFK